jgi:hypothetical protein
LRAASSSRSWVGASAHLVESIFLTREHRPKVHRPGGGFLPAAEDFPGPASGSGTRGQGRSAARRGRKWGRDQDFGAARRGRMDGLGTTPAPRRPATGPGPRPAPGFPPRSRNARSGGVTCVAAFFRNSATSAQSCVNA